MFTFITCGYEHSIANMCGLMLGLLLPHQGMAISLSGYAYNLALATLGNIIAARYSSALPIGLPVPKLAPPSPPQRPTLPSPARSCSLTRNREVNA